MGTEDRVYSERRRERQERRQRLRQRRQRVLAIGALLAVAILVLSLSLASGGHSKKPSVSPTTSAAPHKASPGNPRAVRKQPVAAVHGKPGHQPVPILMYHVINPAPAGAPFPGLYVTPAEFAEQMQGLKDAGYHAVTMDQMLAYWREGAPLPPGKPIVLSFDNGYQSQYTQALPVLRKLGWVGVENIQLTGLPPSQGGLSQAQVRGLIGAGWELDTQGYSHADLITLDSQQLHMQITQTRQTLERRYHVAVNWFCYPSGHYDSTVIQAVKEAGFVGSTTVVPGWAKPSEDPYRLPRLRVLGGTGSQALLGQIASIRENQPPPVSYGSS
jgi:peptidoglycan/xylan/chitin deacetylase (PgdA/CDA1 family)